MIKLAFLKNQKRVFASAANVLITYQCFTLIFFFFFNQNVYRVWLIT